ncbi:hypothetical protein DPMN_156210 [Dreissena polymorpha]|uniref:Uncharacterized protein n=1 Tax=Dreissena polymorpha TaxID=45954 RepID=A0A9D4FV77_DREPO|nr:hypothetical protein DPMN_156210 [Dreissena polymorpha]
MNTHVSEIFIQVRQKETELTVSVSQSSIDVDTNTALRSYFRRSVEASHDLA